MRMVKLFVFFSFFFITATGFLTPYFLYLSFTGSHSTTLTLSAIVGAIVGVVIVFFNKRGVSHDQR